MSELAVENAPDVAEPAREAARGQVVYITEHGERVAAIVPARIAAELERVTPDELAELLADLAREEAGYVQLAADHAAEDAERRQIARRRRPAGADGD